MRISDWSSDVCSSDLTIAARLKLSNAERKRLAAAQAPIDEATSEALAYRRGANGAVDALLLADSPAEAARIADWAPPGLPIGGGALVRSEEHTSELQSLMRNSYAVFCLKKNNTRNTRNKHIASRTSRRY